MSQDHAAVPDGKTRTRDRADPLLGQIIADKYRVHELVAQGGMGRIYRAEQLPLGRIVALKVLKPRPIFESRDPAFERRFLLEASTCAKLMHPNTVTVYDYGQINVEGGNTFFMVLEYVQGRTLTEALNTDGPFPPLRALRVAREITRSLHEAHQLGVVHRDLKPSNVMLVRTDEGESVRVLDFGIAKVLQDEGEGLTIDDNVIGSPRYMPPEQIRHLDIDGRADIYSLGVMLYQMLTGTVPFQREGVVGTLMAHLTEQVPRLEGRTPQAVPASVEALMRRCLEKDRKDRYPNAQALREAIDGVIEALTTEDGLSIHTPHPTVPFDELTVPRNAVARRDEDLFGAPTVLRPAAPQRPRADPPPPVVVPVATPPPDEPAPQRGRRWLPLALIATAAPLLLLSWLVLRDNERGTATPTAGPTADATTADGAPADEPALPALTLLSAPPGASVYEGDALKGLTPLAITFDAGTPRSLRLELDGYTPTTVEVGPVAEDTRQEITLAPVGGAAAGSEGAPAAGAAATRPTRPSSKVGKTGASESKSSGKNLDIIMER